MSSEFLPKLALTYVQTGEPATELSSRTGAEPRNGVHSIIFCQNMFAIIIVRIAKPLCQQRATRDISDFMLL